MSNSFGNRLKITIFGQSHAPSVGCVIEGFPPGFQADMEALGRFLARRAPGRSALATGRREADAPRVMAGLADGKTCGAPLVLLFENADVHSADYSELKNVPRPGHCDYPAHVKYRGWHDVRGGGAFSGRLTLPLSAAGGLCLQWLEKKGIAVGAHIASVGAVADTPYPELPAPELLSAAAAKPFPVLNDERGAAMQALILEAKAAGDSVGGVVECAVTGLPPGLGDPMFGGVENRLSAALFAIPAVKGVEFGAGFQAARLRGSENNDAYFAEAGAVRTHTNRHGGILGGLTTGMPLLLRAAFKPTPSIARPQQSVRLDTLEPARLAVQGRHDPCIVPRAVPVVEAAAALVMMDLLLEEGER